MTQSIMIRLNECTNKFKCMNDIKTAHLKLKNTWFSHAANEIYKMVNFDRASIAPSCKWSALPTCVWGFSNFCLVAKCFVVIEKPSNSAYWSRLCLIVLFTFLSVFYLLSVRLNVSLSFLLSILSHSRQNPIRIFFWFKYCCCRWMDMEYRLCLVLFCIVLCLLCCLV